jgi:alkylation response protein AidB-like acyl-CoA dehydrogenase
VTTDPSAFAAECEAWLAEHAAERNADAALRGEDTDDVSVFHSLPFEEEHALIKAAAAWQATKYDAGFGAISWPVQQGGRGLSSEYERIYATAESRFEVPADHELRRITTNLVAPTLRDLGSAHLQMRMLPVLLSCRELVCQLFSEPSAGSDLANLGTRAIRDGSYWVVNGSKVWVSGAQFADWGLLVARTDPDVAKHSGMTTFLVPMQTEGVDVRPIRQMSGGSSFNEVFFDDVRVPDTQRVGEVGQGWGVALAMLTFERSQSGSKAGVGGSWEQLRALSSLAGGSPGPAARQELVDVYMHEQVRRLTRQRADQARRNGGSPGPEGSLGKVLWTQGLTAIGKAAAALLGPAILADSGQHGTFAWGQHLLGAPGFRIAGGSDEIQRNIIGERLLGLPPEPRVDRDRTWRELSR